MPKGFGDLLLALELRGVGVVGVTLGLLGAEQVEGRAVVGSQGDVVADTLDNVGLREGEGRVSFGEGGRTRKRKKRAREKGSGTNVGDEVTAEDDDDVVVSRGHGGGGFGCVSSGNEEGRGAPDLAL